MGPGNCVLDGLHIGATWRIRFLAWLDMALRQVALTTCSDIFAVNYICFSELI